MRVDGVLLEVLAVDRHLHRLEAEDVPLGRADLHVQHDLAVRLIRVRVRVRVRVRARGRVRVRVRARIRVRVRVRVRVAVRLERELVEPLVAPFHARAEGGAEQRVRAARGLGLS